MIDAKALMIGSIVNFEGNPVKVEQLHNRTVLCSGNCFYYRDIEPIPLTEEWLQKFNLPKREETGPEYSIRNDFEIYCYIDHAGNCLFYGEISTELNEFFIIKCDSVHTFQNIYAILNPSEALTIKA